MKRSTFFTIAFFLFTVGLVGRETPLSHLMFDDEVQEEPAFFEGFDEEADRSCLPWSLEGHLEEVDGWVDDESFYDSKVSMPTHEEIAKRRSFFGKPKVVTTQPKRTPSAQKKVLPQSKAPIIILNEPSKVRPKPSVKSSE